MENIINKKILVVDDEEEIVTLLSRALRARGYTVITAQDGEEALKQTNLHQPDLIITDLNMPNISGWRLSQKLREKEAHKKIPIILLSALVGREGPAGDLEVGNYYMGKPFDMEKILEKIREFLPE